MKSKILIVSAAAVLMAGCASTSYDTYVQTQKEIAQAQAQADIARYEALSRIAEQGDSAAKVAAVMSLNMMGGAQGKPTQIAAPVSAGDQALRWAGVLVPGVTQAYGIYANAKLSTIQSNNSAAVAMNQANNQTAVAIDTNATMGGIATLITEYEPTVVTNETVTVVEQPTPIVEIVQQPAPVVVDPTVVNPVVVDPLVVNPVIVGGATP